MAVWINPVSWLPGMLANKGILDYHLRDNLNLLKTDLEALSNIAHTFAVQTADVTVNNSTTVVDLTGLTFDVVSGETWIFLSALAGQANSTADFRIALTGPTASASSISIMSLGDSGSKGFTTTWATELTPGSSGGGDPEQIMIYGYLVASSTATVQIQGAQRVAQANDCKYFKGGYVVAFKVS